MALPQQVPVEPAEGMDGWYLIQGSSPVSGPYADEYEAVEAANHANEASSSHNWLDLIAV